MLSEYEVESLMEYPEVAEKIKVLKKNFLNREAPLLEISDQDFLSLSMMSPAVGIAMSDGLITLSEEIKLNKQARKLSKGAYLLKRDPVVTGMKFMISKFYHWEADFYALLRGVMEIVVNLSELKKQQKIHNSPTSRQEYVAQVFNEPYMLIRFVESFFLIVEENFQVGEVRFQGVEMDNFRTIIKKLEIDNFPFVKTLARIK